MIEIKRQGNVIYTITDIGEGSKVYYTLMESHYVLLKFSSDEPFNFKIGDKTEIPNFGTFVVTSPYYPKYNDTNGGYDFELKLEADYRIFANKILKYRPLLSVNETSFSLTSSIDKHVAIIIDNLKALNLTHNGKDYIADWTTYNNEAFNVNDAFNISYSAVSILDALSSICSKLDCEYWIDGNVIYFGYCEMKGQSTVFELGKNVITLSSSESKSNFVTKLYAFGSDKNVPKGYFTGQNVDVTVHGTASENLRLLNNIKGDFYSKDGYISNINIIPLNKEDEAVEGVVVFDDVYPKVECSISTIKTYESTVEEDGEKNTQTFWMVTDESSTFCTNFERGWIKDGLTLMVKFISGSLNGMEFECNFKTVEDIKFFEIIANTNYGRTLPDKALSPKKGDKFVIYNWDSSKITETNLIVEAQRELFDRAVKYYQKTMIDPTNFTCTLSFTENLHTIGEQVKLVSDVFFEKDEKGKGYRNSRIIGYEINLDYPNDAPSYTVGEKASQSRLSKLENKIDTITINGNTRGNIGQNSGVYVIGTSDSTQPTDSNVYSSLRSQKEFLSKKNDDEANGLINFKEGLKINGDEAEFSKDGNLKAFNIAARRVIEAKNAILSENATVGENIKLTKEGLIEAVKAVFGDGGLTVGNFISSLLVGQGAEIDRMGNAELQSLKVRSSLEVKELIYNRLTATEGSFVFSENGTIESVEKETNDENIVYRLTIRSRYDGDFTSFKEGDILMGSVNELSKGGKYYDSWLRVIDVNAAANLVTTILYQDKEVPSKKNYPPTELMFLIRWGSVSDEKRQSLWYLSSSEKLFVMLDHVTKPILDKTNYSIALGTLPESLQFIFANYPQADPNESWLYAKGIAVQNHLRVDYEGGVVATARDRGIWSFEEAKNNPYQATSLTVDYVYNLGCKWRCLNTGTLKEPKYASTDWAFVEGNPNFEVEIQSSNGWSFDADIIQQRDNFGHYIVFTELSLNAFLYNQDVTKYVDIKDVEWLRDTGNTTEDNQWAALHSASGKTVNLTWDDLGTSATQRKTCSFKVIASLKDGITASEEITLNL